VRFQTSFEKRLKPERVKAGPQPADGFGGGKNDRNLLLYYFRGKMSLVAALYEGITFLVRSKEPAVLFFTQPVAW